MYGWSAALRCSSPRTLLIFAAIGLSGVRIGIAFYLWIGVFNMAIVAQFWAFANDLYSAERGKRLFPILGMGANLGAFVGAAFASVVFGGFGPYSLMLLAAAGLLVPVGLTIWVSRREQRVATTCHVGRPSSPSADPAGSSWFEGIGIFS